MGNEIDKVKERVIDFDTKIDILENQIHIINTKLLVPEKKSWLKRNIAIILSIIALVTSVFFSVYSILESNEEKAEIIRTEKLKKVEDLIVRLTEVEEKSVRLSSENLNSSSVNTLSVLNNLQRQIYVSEIIHLIEQVDEKFRSNIYSILGTELKQEGHYKKATEYFHLERLSASSPMSKTVAYRNLGQIYAIPHTGITSIDSANYYRNLSITESINITGEQQIISKGYSYQLWAADEFYLGNYTRANELVNFARNEYEKLPATNLSRQNNIRLINQLLESQAKKETTEILENLNGAWESKINNGYTLKAHFNPNVNGWYCNIEIAKNDKIQYTFYGPLISISDSKLNFTLQGTRRIYLVNNPLNDKMPTLGSMSLRINEDSPSELILSLNEFNKQKSSYSIQKRL